MAERPENRVFGKRAQQHVVILASGDRIRHMTVRPWMVAVTFCFAGMFTVGYLAATSYLVLRDDLIGATMARQARMQHDYEDRISALRAQVDRVTSRQLLDQQVVEEKVEKLMQQQLALSARHGKLDALLNRAENAGAAPLTDETPAVDGRRADAAGAIDAIMGGAGGTPKKTAALAYAATGESVADRADRLFSKVTLSLKDLEHDQIDRIQSLTAGASETADAIRTILRRTGFDVTVEAADDDSETAIGGPFVEPVDVTDPFEASINDLDTALDRLDTARRTARKLPFGNPSPASSITSRFGNRTDPFLGRLALHAGIDFRARTGTRIGATGAGTVVVAGRNGGYGNMVEIDHGNGLTTRYAHLSRVLVKVGQRVEATTPIGLSGTTGRSTGPHLHYEVRRNGKALDPMRFLTAGMKLTTYMD
ncbi:M23 family metallopeptidase [Shinella sp. S4-D37]|uniref:M23 family metallopeptidase n=1 Tax=Shinella sp. S4-D37 TaxID=3161999 RepID=UPI0034661371